MSFVDHYAIFIKHCRVEIMAFPFVFSQRWGFQFLLSFAPAILCCIFAQTLPPATVTTCSYYYYYYIRRDKPELTRWCFCSLHAGIQMSPDEVVGSRDGCHHSIAESTVDVPVPIRLFRQFFSDRTALFSCPFE